MKKRNLLSTILSCSILATTTLPSFALEATPEVITEEVSQERATQSKNLDVIEVRFKKDMNFDVGAKKKEIITLYTVEPIQNKNGQIVIPRNTRVCVELEPVFKGKDKGTKMNAKFLAINGTRYSLNAISSTIIPAYKVKEKTRFEQSDKFRSSFGKPFSGSNSSNGSVDNQSIKRNAEVIGSAIGFLSPRSKLISRFSKDEVYMLELTKPLSLDTIQYIPPTSSTSQPQQEEDIPVDGSESETTQQEDIPVDGSNSETTQQEDIPVDGSNSEPTK